MTSLVVSRPHYGTREMSPEEVAELGTFRVAHARECQYPPVPAELFRLREIKRFIVPASGVYFVFSGDGEELIYVGSSINLRTRLSSNHRVLNGNGELLISWLAFDRKELMFAEAYYIGLCRPRCNGGGQAVKEFYS